MFRGDEKFPDNGFEAWGGYMQAKITKLEEQFTSKADRSHKLSNIFDGVSIYVNGFTSPSADELKELMYKHGGVYHTYRRQEDFIIASNLPDTKVKNMSLSRVVKPEWITESIEAHKLLDYKNYLLYRNSRTQPQLCFPKTERPEDNKTNVESHTMSFDTTSITNAKTRNTLPHINLNTDESKTIPPDSKMKVPDSSIINNLNLHNDKKEQMNTVRNARTAVDPNFISEFYNNSRLHHISQLGASFKQYINDLRDTSKYEFPAWKNLKEKVNFIDRPFKYSQLKFENNKVIMHIDMDCFFVSVGLCKRPELRGRPVAVTHSKGGQVQTKRPGVNINAEINLYKRKLSKVNGIPEEDMDFDSRLKNVSDEGDKFGSLSEISSCSYEARAKGITNGMFMGPALKLCPDLQTIPYDFDGYKEVAYILYNTVAQYTLDIEAVSCDEMYVDCTELLINTNISVQDFATALRSEIKEKTGCPCSTGFGGNRLQARLATKKAKPDGQFFLSENLVQDFMEQIELKDLPGVGKQTAQKLQILGHVTCGSLQSLSLDTLQHHLGNKTGAQLYDQCRGRDPNPLSYYTVRKSVSAEVNYGIRFENNEQCYEFLKQLSNEVHLRMLQYKVLGKSITLKLMVRDEEAPVETAKFMGHGFCNTINKSTSLANATNDAEIITREVITLCKKHKIDPKEMRGIGIQISKLENSNTKPSKGAISKYLSSNKLVPSKPNVTDNSSKEGNATLAAVKLSTFLSPKKLTVLTTSTKQKSPVLGTNKSPFKRRGRPAKINKTTTIPSRNLMNKFLQGQSNSFNKVPFISPFISNPQPLETIDKEFMKPNEHSGLIGLPWEKVRDLLSAWVDSGQNPLSCDINMVTEYMRMKVINRKIEDLYFLTNFLSRTISKIDSSSWSKVFEHILDNVQNAMIAVYGKRLYVNY